MDTNINYQFKSSAKARSIRISIYPESLVVVTKPTRIADDVAMQFVMSKSKWILKKSNQLKNRKTISVPAITSKTKQETLRFVKERVEIFNEHYHFKFNKISIKSHKNLWGSCSSKKNLNFNYKLMHLPQEQADYIIVHELCHLKELNHSRQFWALVTETIPDFRRIKKELKSFLFV
jgi:predicted metal-dependent hydrolase